MRVLRSVFVALSSLLVLFLFSQEFTPMAVADAKSSKTNYKWETRSMSSMKETKDRMCNVRPKKFIDRWVRTTRELGVNYISIETPYDNPACGNSILYTKYWVEAARKHGLSVWHRHMPLAFEGIYGVAKNNKMDYLGQISNYIRNNSNLFSPGDIFTPIPEPQNGGIRYITYCPQGVCQFVSAQHFNAWLRSAMQVSEQAFAAIGLGGQVRVGYWGFDGFVAWGDNNPDWTGILEDQTVNMMGNITIDHYPETVRDTMENDLRELQARYPNVPIIIGEWGTVTGGDIVGQVNRTMSAARIPGVVGFNYWHMGVGGNEALINEDFSKRPQFSTVQSFFLGY